ncbi:hypothetical protein NMG60_11003781 [Bertholletia excelsa]
MQPNYLSPVLPPLLFLSHCQESTGKFFWKKRRLCKHNPRACKRFSSHHSCCFKRYCVNIYANPSHCGSCGHVCKYGKRCCDGACVDTMKDTRHCGSCGRHCPQGEICVFGMCGYG